MTRQTLLGALFLLVGLAIVAVVLAPVVVAVIGKSPAPTISVFLLTIGIGLAVFGAWLIPSSGVGQTVTQVTVALGGTSLPFFGGRRASDTGTVTATATVTRPSSDAPPPPADGA